MIRNNDFDIVQIVLIVMFLNPVHTLQPILPLLSIHPSKDNLFPIQLSASSRLNLPISCKLFKSRFDLTTHFVSHRSNDYKWLLWGIHDALE